MSLLDIARRALRVGKTQVPRENIAEYVKVDVDSSKNVINFNQNDVNLIANPYPVYRELRESSPVFRNRSALWIITRYSDVAALLADERAGNAPSPYAVLNSRNRSRYVCADVANNILPFIDAPQHIVPRKFIGRVFYEFINENPLRLDILCETLLDALIGKKEIDVLSDYATPLSLQVMSRILGLPNSDQGKLKHWSEKFFYLFNPIPSNDIREELDRSLSEFRQYFSQIIQERKVSPEPDLISWMLRDAECISEAELIDTCMLLYADGIENVDAAIANAIMCLLQHPDQLALLRESESHLPAAVEECLRFESPAQMIARVARQEITLGSKIVPENAGLLLVLGSANRDEAQFEKADIFDIQRSANAHLAFGKGRHSCIGGRLVREEMQSALKVFLANYTEIDLINPVLEWQPRAGHRWLKRLPVKVVRH